MQKLTTAIAARATRRLTKRHSILLYQGEAPRMAYVIRNGLVKMYSINSSGEEQVVAFCGAEDYFPIPWIYQKTPTTLYYYEAITDCEIYTLPREELVSVINRPEMIHTMMEHLVSSHTSLLLHITALEQLRAREKVLFTLYHMLFRYGREKAPGIYTIDFPLTHKIIASLVGLTRETTSTEISKLKRQKIIDYRGAVYTVSKIKLERSLGENSFSDVVL